MLIETPTHVYFWERDSIYSNWYTPCNITLPSTTEDDTPRYFENSEALMMWLKATFFGDTEVADRIYWLQEPKGVRDLGRLVKGFDQKLWEEVRETVMYETCYAKFSQNDHMKASLLLTGDKILVEASPFDKVWGVGLRPDDPLVLDEKNWKGLNLLGKALMKVRAKLLEELLAS
jgi:ribA/ribD-fused uncharacterized protein